uniref:Reverse transcriptase domain-containing protein n=1 Tax=Pygocentrus nattereri TaxID=42514 RepID=A0AAR2M0N9_PYGNA
KLIVPCHRHWIFVKFISREIDDFLECNQTPGMSYFLIWETLKAYLRGQIISYSARVKKKQQERLKKIESDILQLDGVLSLYPSTNLFKERLALQTEFNLLSTKLTENLLNKSRHKSYEHGEKIGKILAHQLRQQRHTEGKDKFKYLGICVTNNYKHLYKANFIPLMDSIKQDFKRWRTLPISLGGRINTVKMNILPRFLYLFQCIPIFLTKSFFLLIDKLISAFIWNGKNARIRKSILQRHREHGGLSLPNFQYYYWAANARSMLYWFKSYIDGPEWLSLENLSCQPASLHALSSYSSTTIHKKKSISRII